MQEEQLWDLSPDRWRLTADFRALQGYEITVEEVEEDEKVRLHALLLSMAFNLYFLPEGVLLCSCHNCKGRMAVQASMQPKAAVEFDQAINYVNKIKVR